MRATKDIILYHVTPTKNLPNVMRQGLVPQLRPDSGVHKPVIYLAASPRAAAIWAIDFQEGTQDTQFTEPMSVLAVRIKKGSESYFDPESFGEGFYITKRIPPENLRVVSRDWSGKFPEEREEQYETRYERLRESLMGFPKPYEV